MSATEYRKLIAIVWLVVFASMATIWGPNAWNAASWDTDDFMRLIQVRDWLAGQGWSDLTQYRLNPPDGTPMHWSRLPDLPLAAVTLAALPFASMNDALTVAAMVVPPLYFLAFLIAYALPARLLLGSARSPVALLVAIAGSAMITMFAPGRVDHHGIQLVMVMISVALLIFGLARQRWSWVIALAGFPIGLSIWIGLEMVPVIAAWFAALGLIWCRSGGALALRGATAAGIAVAIGLFLLLTSVAPADRWKPACDALSVMPVGTLALVAAGFVILHAAGRFARQPLPRLAIGALAGGGVGMAYVLLFPACLDGPYSAMDPEVAHWWLSNVPEALPLLTQFEQAPFRALDKLWAPALALAYCLWRFARAQARGRDLWGALAVLVAVSSLLIFWQIRTAPAAHVVALIPLAGLIADLWRRLGGARGPRWRRLVLLLPVLFFGSAVFWPALEKASNLAATAIPAMPRETLLMVQECTNRSEMPVVAAMPPMTVLSYIDVGPMLLFSTPHRVLGGPYHRNITGLTATVLLFRSTDDAWIRDQLRALEVGLVAICPGPEDYLIYRTESGEGLAERLAKGRTPDYLAEVPDLQHPGFKLYRVLP